MKIIDLENWLSNFPDYSELRFCVDGKFATWTGGIQETTFPTKRGDLSPVSDIVTLEFTYGADQVQEQARP